MTGRHELVNQPSSLPTAKVLATWATGSGAVVVLALVAAISDSVSADTFWGGLVTAVLAGAAGYVKRNRRVDA